MVQDEQLWVAECGDVLAGFASVWVIDNFLHNLFVDPQWQGKGVGSLLLEQVQRSFKHSGTLKCLSRNETPCASTSITAGNSKPRARLLTEIIG